jgi:mercuric ion binding protein
MRQTFAAAVLTLAFFSSGSAVAAGQKVTLQVENMYCASCPFIVKRALAGVPGVTNVEISYEKAISVAVAIVEYEDTKVDVAALTAATSDVGFLSRVMR